MGFYKGEADRVGELKVSPAPVVYLQQLHEWRIHFDDPRLQEEMWFSFSILDRIRAFTAERGLPLVVIATPLQAQLPLGGRPGELSLASIHALEQFGRTKKIPFQCPLKEFCSACEHGEKVFHVDGMYPTGAGHDLWAAALAAFLRERIPALHPNP